MGQSGFTYLMILTLNFPDQLWNLLWNEKQTFWLISSPQMWPSGLTLTMTLTLILKVKYLICYILWHYIHIYFRNQGTVREILYDYSG